MGLPENINTLLVKFDIKQKDLAKVAGVSPSNVTRWINQGAQMRKEPLQRICDYFGLTEDDLLSTESGLAAKEHRQYQDTIAFNLTRREAALVDAFRALDERGKNVVETVAWSQRGDRSDSSIQSA